MLTLLQGYELGAFSSDLHDVNVMRHWARTVGGGLCCALLPNHILVQVNEVWGGRGTGGV
jgi:hypothetical protein